MKMDIKSQIEKLREDLKPKVVPSLIRKHVRDNYIQGLKTINRLPEEYKEHTHLTPSKARTGIILQTRMPLPVEIAPKRRGARQRNIPKSA